MKIGIFDASVETPEEIIMAAGITPVRLFGDLDIGVDKANEHIPPTHCVWARNILEQAINGFQDRDIKGVVGTHGCDCTNREFDIWIECVKLDFLFFLNSPLKRDKIAQKFFVDDIKELIKQLEEKFKVQINNEKISEAIKLTNKVRKVLKEISEYRNKYILKGSEFHELVRFAQTNDKKKVLSALELKIKELKNKKKFEDKNIKRILLTGSVIDDSEFIRFLETLGFQVVIDDLCVGTMYFWNLVGENKNPIESLAEYHLNKPIYSIKFPSYRRLEFLKELAKKYQVDGIINYAQKFCESVLYDHPYLSRKFKELGIPYLFVEVEYNRESYKQLATRFEAFHEML